MESCLGVDGAKSGWIAMWLGEDGLAWCVYDSARELVDRHRGARVIAVDIPIGLSDRDGRQADIQARKFVGGRRACSIFSTPVRGILDAASQAEASRRHREIDGRGFGAQSFAILPKIRQWDELLQGDAHARQMVREIHPEVCFAALNGGLGHGLVDAKRTQTGMEKRIALLAPVFGQEQVMGLVQAMPRREAATDDVLDALVALWSAGRIAAGCAGSLPAPVMPDATGLPATIWY
jgi:predicted RNase H-like nuclease